MTRVLSGAIKRSTCASRFTIAPATKRSRRLCGSCSMLTRGMNRPRIDCQKVVRGKSSRHHNRQRFNVRAGILSHSHSCRPEELPGGEASINTTARYTRRAAKRTDGEVERASQCPQVKLKRRE